MEKTETSVLAGFTAVHDQFISDWGSAMQSGDTTMLERMTEDYYVAFFYGASGKPMIFSREEAISGMRESVQELLGARKRFDHRLIRMKGEDEAVVFYELVIEQDGKDMTRLFTVEYWIQVDGEWLLSRETNEQVG